MISVRARYRLKKQLKQALKALIPPPLWNRLRPAPPLAASFSGKVDTALLADWISARQNDPAPTRPDLLPGITLVGFYSSATGLGEAFRGLVHALWQQEFPLSVVDVTYGVPPAQRLPADQPAIPRGFLHQTNLIYLNPNHLPQLWAEYGPRSLLGRYTIGHWTWELPSLAAEWLPALPLFDEFWAMSRFIQQTIASATLAPVHLVPPQLETAWDPGLTRADFALPPHPRICLLVYDINSLSERKNPLGAIEAFRLALEASALPLHLAVKVNNSAENPREMEALRTSLAGLPATLIQETMPSARMNALIRLSDCVLSLHRAEGYGMVGAKAVRLGTPVIATGWSGSRDWMDSPLVFPVGYTLVPVPGMPGQRWADPDLSQAADQLVRLFSSP